MEGIECLIIIVVFIVMITWKLISLRRLLHPTVIQSVTDSSHSFSVSIWDRVFRSYTDKFKQGHDKMTLGLAQYQHPQEVSVLRLLVPFKRAL